MDKKANNFFRRSFCCVVAICIVVFVWMAMYMGQMTENAITDIVEIYMDEVNTQIQQKFSSIIDLRLEQVEGIIKRTPPDTVAYGDDMLAELQSNTEIRNFSYLGFLTEDGGLTAVYGEEVQFTGSDDVFGMLASSGYIVTEGVTGDEETVLLLGVEASYPMAEGRSVALLAGVSMDYLNEVLYLYEDEAVVYSHIIDGEGNFVIKNGDAYRGNYFDRIMEVFDELNGKTPEEYAEELREAMASGESYLASIFVDGDLRHIYCTPLPDNTSWYLITVMPDGILSETITEIGTSRTRIMVCCGLVILITMSVLLVLYYRISQRQLRDLAEARKEAEHASMAKSQFLSSMSHDIRTPMNAIIGMTEIAQKNIQDSERVEDCLRKVMFSSKHLLGLINDVLDMSKIESGKMTLSEHPLSLRDVMDDLVNIIQPQVKSRDQYFDIFIQEILSEEVYCDDVRLNQVLLNLVSNAVKYTPQEGRIDVRLYQEKSEKGEEYVRTHFLVEDTGIGMSKEFQEKIWDTFAREDTDTVRQTTGSGLGMAITKRIVDMMGGTIVLTSEKGKGSCFHVTLDLKKASVTEKEMALPPWNVLVVDDNEQLCLSAVTSLEELGVHAEWTQDGRKAVQMIEEHHKQNDDYQFVLIDWKMPNMDGVQTIHEIREKVDKEIPVFLISAYDWSDIEDQIQASEVEGFISKPLFKSTLFSHLSRYADTESSKSEQMEQEKELEADFSGKHVLLAEDMDINWEVASELLSITGIELDRAVNGKDCLEQFKQSEIGYYDAILMDIRMPVMDGYEATKAIRALERADKDLPIIAMTADAFSDDARQCMEYGMNAHIPKPLDIRECIRVLKNYLEPH